MTFKTPERAVGATLDVYETEVLRLMGLEQYAEAYVLLERQTNPSLANLYNMALCLYFSEAYTACLLLVERAVSKLPAYALRHQKWSHYAQNINTHQMAKDTYLCPVSELYTLHFSALLKDSLLRLQVDCYVYLRDWTHLAQTLEQIQAKGYANVERALKQLPTL